MKQQAPYARKICDALGVPCFYLLMNDGQWETYQQGLTASGKPRLNSPLPPDGKR
jgi:hypothetical protein